MGESNFNVLTYNMNPEKISHWAKGLNMVITKDNVTICLNEEEIKQLVNTLPRTFGGSY